MKSNTQSNKIYDVATLLLISGIVIVLISVLSLVLTSLEEGGTTLLCGIALIVTAPVVKGLAILVRNAEMEIDERNRADYE